MAMAIFHMKRSRIQVNWSIFQASFKLGKTITGRTENYSLLLSLGLPVVGAVRTEPALFNLCSCDIVLRIELYQKSDREIANDIESIKAVHAIIR